MEEKENFRVQFLHTHSNTRAEHEELLRFQDAKR
jgi:hypothetical protein